MRTHEPRRAHRARRASGSAGPLAAVVAVVLAAGACGAPSGADTASGPGPEDVDLDGGSIAQDIDLEGASLSVSSKEFTESVILGKITYYALQAAGAEADDQTGLMGSNILRTALENGDVDLYWEYAGTGWTQFLQEEEVIHDGMEQFDRTAEEDLDRNGIAWLGPAQFGNQYAVARAADAPEPVGSVDSLDQLSEFVHEHPEEATFCGAAEFMDREWERFQDFYDAPFRAADAYQMDLALNYVNVARGSPCNFAEIFTTDARIDSLDLEVVEDSDTFFTTQLAALTARQESVDQHPGLDELGTELGEALTEETIIELNGMVDLDGASPDEAALYFLSEHGFIG
ncbi:glycine betaine ABC transporter substrate-binding protein [Nocardiopsis oceani]